MLTKRVRVLPEMDFVFVHRGKRPRFGALLSILARGERSRSTEGCSTATQILGASLKANILGDHRTPFPMFLIGSVVQNRTRAPA